MAKDVMDNGNGNKKFVNTAQQDRLAPLLRHRFRFSVIFLASAVGAPSVDYLGGFVQQTTSRTVGIFGADDANVVTNTMAPSGYTDLPNVGLTTGYAGGAVADKVDEGDPLFGTVARILGIGFQCADAPRYLNAAGGAAEGWTTAVVSQGGGNKILADELQTPQFFSSIVKDCDVQALPQGSVSACAPYVTLVDLAPSGVGKSTDPTIGWNMNMVRYGLGQELYVQRGTGDSTRHPNRFQLTWHAANVATVGATRIAYHNSYPAAHATADLLCMDMTLIVDIAITDTDGNPVDEISKRKIEAYNQFV